MNAIQRTQLSLVASLALTLVACGARTQQEVGGKTSWLSTCGRDADCAALEGAVCIQELCTVTCESNDCDAIEGTSCVERSSGCLTESTCLPTCSNDSDCRRFGDGYTCRASTCVEDSCATLGGNTETPDGSVSSTAPAESSSVGGVVGSTQSEAPASTSASTLNPSQATTSAAASDTVTDGGGDSSGAPIVCAVSMEGEPEQRPYKTLLEESGYDSFLSGEPACNGACGYEYSSFDEFWVLDSALQCPLDTSACAELQASLTADPARCNADADCTFYSGSFRPCQPFLDQPRYFDSTLFTTEERAAREAVLFQMQQHGCRIEWLGWDGPAYELGCVDNLCTLVEAGSCDGSYPSVCDACVPNVDAGLSE